MAAKMYRETESLANKSLAQGWTAVMKVQPLDGDQAPGAYLKTVKLSVCPGDTGSSNQVYLIAAATVASISSVDDIITAQAFNGPGTAWLNLRRKINASAAEGSRNDGVVYIHIFSGAAHSALVVTECWGRFTNLVSA